MSKSWTIFNAAIACRRIFRKALTVSRLTQQEWAENRLAEFNLWAAGAGAYATEKASMDYRLRDNQDAHTILVNLLFMLEILVQKCIDEAHQADDSVPALSKVESTRMKDVEDSLNQLTRLTTAIRKAGIRSRLQKADSSFDPNDARIRSLRRHLECLVLVYPEEHGSSYSSEQQRDTARLTPIQLRLIDANLRRRNRFLYAQQHAQKLGIDSEKPENMSSETFTLVKQVPSLDVGEAATLSQEEKIGTKDSRQVQSTTTATLVDEPIVIPPKEVVRSTTTVVSVTSSRISYPRPPPIKDNREFFRCPCCCLPLPIAIARGNQWKKHLAGDILPYTCILENCPQTGKFYMTKEAWLSHMDDEHEGREQWICHVCSQKNIYATFRESSEFTAHVEQDHSKGIKPQQIPMLLSAWRCKIPLEISTCPLCRFESDDQNAVLDHIAEHIHSFSLRSLPWAPREGLEEENDEEEYGTYFKQHPYFDIHSSRSELSSNSPGMSSVITDTGSFAGDDFENPAESPRQQQAELTEDLLNQVPYGVSGQVNTSDWLAMLSNDPENPNPSPGNVLADWNVDDLPSLYKQVGPDWFAVFNTEVQRVLDVELVHHLVHDSVVSCVRFSWDGKYVATGCCRSANIFDVATGQSVATLQDESVDGDIIIRSVCFSPDGEHLATGSEDNQIRIWDIATRSIKHVFTGHEEEVHSLDFAGNGRYITSGSADKTVRVWDVLEGKLIYTLSISYGFTTVAISPNGVSFPNGVYIAAGALDNGVRIWDMTTGYLVERLENPDGHKDCVYSVAFAPNGRDLVSGSLDKTIKMWELTAPRGMLPGTGVKGGKCVQTFEGHKDSVFSVCFTPDGRWVISGSKDCGVQFWDPTTGNAHMRLVGHKASVISVAPSPTSNLFATGSGDMRARIWRYSTKNT